MKNLTIIAAAFFVMSLASCKKDYDCICTSEFLGVETSATTTINDTKSNAEEACEEGSGEVSGVTVTCELED